MLLNIEKKDAAKLNAEMHLRICSLDTFDPIAFTAEQENTWKWHTLLPHAPEVPAPAAQAPVAPAPVEPALLPGDALVSEHVPGHAVVPHEPQEPVRMQPPMAAPFRAPNWAAMTPNGLPGSPLLADLRLPPSWGSDDYSDVRSLRDRVRSLEKEREVLLDLLRRHVRQVFVDTIQI